MALPTSRRNTKQHRNIDYSYYDQRQRRAPGVAESPNRLYWRVTSSELRFRATPRQPRTAAEERESGIPSYTREVLRRILTNVSTVAQPPPLRPTTYLTGAPSPDSTVNHDRARRSLRSRRSASVGGRPPLRVFTGSLTSSCDMLPRSVRSQFANVITPWLTASCVLHSRSGTNSRFVVFPLRRSVQARCVLVATVRGTLSDCHTTITLSVVRVEPGLC